MQKRRRITRPLSALLALLFLFSAVGFSAGGVSAAPATTAAPAAAPIGVPTESLGILLRDLFWANFVVLSFMYSPQGGYFYTEKEPPQALFGFNELYDRFTFLAWCFADTIHCKFRYDERDWLVQLWKGSYGMLLFTGGEIGIYNKPVQRELEHYDCAEKADWIGMEMTIYREGEKLFNRPMEDCWWETGFAFGILPNLFSAPRTNCTMESRLQFPDAKMAALFADQLAEKGFTKRKTVSTDFADSYAIKGDTVHLYWQAINESMF